ILLCRIASRWFLFPDNGAADLVLQDQPPEQVLRIRQKDSPYILAEVSKTFHGRDLFAPIASYLSRGIRPEELGEPCPLPKPRFSFCRRPATKASVLHIDHFGNIVTDIMGNDRRPASLLVGRKKIRRWISTYAEAPAGTLCLVTGSSGLIEIVVNGGSAAAKLRADSGTAILVAWK
ncbi:MAG TPA: SAM-dependent chlorinase/fluorinase, partial [Bacteroidota bacterium]